MVLSTLGGGGAQVDTCEGVTGAKEVREGRASEVLDESITSKDATGTRLACMQGSTVPAPKQAQLIFTTKMGTAR